VVLHQVGALLLDEDGALTEHRVVDAWYFSWQAFTDSASMRACAGS
jgi:hypothetical protein